MHRFTKILIAFALVCFVTLTTRASGILENDPNLVLHYDFETQSTNNTIVDTSSYGNNAIQFNATNYLTYTNGVFGGTAAQFTYVNSLGASQPMSQYAAITNLTGFAVMTNATISIWLQFAPSTNSVITILDSGYNSALVPNASNSWAFGRYGNFDKYVSFWVYPITGGASNVLKWPATDLNTTSFTTTRMHLYTATFDCTSNIATAYFDGVYYTNCPVIVPNLRVYGCSSVRWLCLGASAHNGTPQWADSPDHYPNDGFFAGRMDDLRIYNRTLSAIEVKALYSAARFVTATSTAPGQVQISWRGTTNVAYQVETCSDLSGQAWSSVGTPILSSGGLDSLTDSPVSDTSFYRVRPTQ